MTHAFFSYSFRSGNQEQTAHHCQELELKSEKKEKPLVMSWVEHNVASLASLGGRSVNLSRESEHYASLLC